MRSLFTGKHCCIALSVLMLIGCEGDLSSDFQSELMTDKVIRASEAAPQGSPEALWRIIMFTSEQWYQDHPGECPTPQLIADSWEEFRSDPNYSEQMISDTSVDDIDFNPLAWTASRVFPDGPGFGVENNQNDNLAPPILRRYCSYEYTCSEDPDCADETDDVVDASNDLLLLLENDFNSMYLPFVSSVSRDSFVVTSMGSGTNDVPDEFFELFQGEFFSKAGKPANSWPVIGEESTSRLKIIDTKPRRWGPDNSGHGYALENMAKALLCNDGAENCVADISTELAVSYEVFDYNDKSQTIENRVDGGLVGLMTKLGQGIYQAVAHGPMAFGTVLNLSVAWDGIWGGKIYRDNNPELDLPVHIRAVYHALEVASCKGAIAIAAAGNRLDFTDQHKGAKYPALWEEQQAPDWNRCRELMGWSSFEEIGDDPKISEYFDVEYEKERQPLLWASAGVGPAGYLLGSAADGSQSVLLAYADHAMVQARAADNTLDSQLAPTRVLTGSSVAALVISSTAAAIAHFTGDPLPYRVMSLLNEHGTVLYDERGFTRNSSPDFYHESFYGESQSTSSSNSSPFIRMMAPRNYRFADSLWGSMTGVPGLGRGLIQPNPEAARFIPKSKIISVCPIVSAVCGQSGSCPNFQGNSPLACRPQLWEHPVMPTVDDSSPVYLPPSPGNNNELKSYRSVYSTPVTVPQPNGPTGCGEECMLSLRGVAVLNYTNPIDDMRVMEATLLVGDRSYDIDALQGTLPQESRTLSYAISDNNLSPGTQAQLVTTLGDTATDTVLGILVSDLLVVQ